MIDPIHAQFCKVDNFFENCGVELICTLYFSLGNIEKSVKFTKLTERFRSESLS